jgi:S-adenosylmethionine:tRNA ribosyltransferase-isomerase
VTVRFDSPHLVESLYAAGSPIQYSYLEEELKVWDQQTLFSSFPISVEPASASFPFTWQTLFKLQERGVHIGSLLHGAGISSTGDSEFDKVFPLDEFFEIPKATIKQIQETKLKGGRVFALGTTVARALESAFLDEKNIIASGRTELRLSRTSQLRVTDCLITGMHEPETSHFHLMEAFGKTETLTEQTKEYRSHEYGDLTIFLKSAR